MSGREPGLPMGPEDYSARFIVYQWMRRNELNQPDAVRDFEDAMASGLGARVQLAAALDSDLEGGVTVTLDEIQADEYSLLRVLRQERDRFRDEKQRNGH